MTFAAEPEVRRRAGCAPVDRQSRPTFALTTFLLAPLTGPPSAAHVAGGHCSLAFVALASLGFPA